MCPIDSILILTQYQLGTYAETIDFDGNGLQDLYGWRGDEHASSNEYCSIQYKNEYYIFGQVSQFLFLKW